MLTCKKNLIHAYIFPNYPQMFSISLETTPFPTTLSEMQSKNKTHFNNDQF